MVGPIEDRINVALGVKPFEELGVDAETIAAIANLRNAVVTLAVELDQINAARDDDAAGASHAAPGDAPS
jgi:hypothetical protein